LKELKTQINKGAAGKQNKERGWECVYTKIREENYEKNIGLFILGPKKKFPHF